MSATHRLRSHRLVRVPAALSLLLGALPAARGQGTPVWEFSGAGPFDHLGTSVAGAGDVDGDGLADPIVGAPEASPGGLAFAGQARVF